jgi:hypothetical protein
VYENPFRRAVKKLKDEYELSKIKKNVDESKKQ